MRSVVSDDAAALRTVAAFLDDERVLVEPLCAAALAPLYETPDLFRGLESIVVVVCGGNLVTLDDALAWRGAAAG